IHQPGEPAAFRRGLHFLDLVLRSVQVGESTGGDLNTGQGSQVPAAGRAGAEDELAILRPLRAVVLGVALVTGQRAGLTLGDIHEEEVLVEVRLGAANEKEAVVGGPAAGLVVAARALLHQPSGGRQSPDGATGGLTSPARLDRLHIEVKSAGIVAICAEGELIAVAA